MQNLIFTDTKLAISKDSYLMYQAFFYGLLTGSIKGKLPERNKKASVLYTITDNGKKSTSNYNEITENSVGVVKLTGLMMKYGNYYAWGSDEIVAMLEYLDHHTNIKAIVLVVDSGGGYVSAIAPYLNFFANKKKPVVVLADLCASAALWATAPADYKIADNDISSSFGSVGIMAEYVSYANYYKELGIDTHTIKSNFSEHKNENFELAMEGKYDQIKEEEMDPLALKFHADLKTYVPNLNTTETGVLTGKVFYAKKAKKLGFINEIGNMDRAIEMAHLLADAQNIANQFN